MPVFEYDVNLKDGVTSAAKQAASSVRGLADTMKNNLSKGMFDASNAMNAGKESIGAAAEGIKNAFKSLAAGDVSGALDGLVGGIANAAKSLDLLVPGLGEAVSAFVTFAGGVAGAVLAGAKFAIAMSQDKAAMLSMFDALGEGAISGEKVDDMLDDLRAKTGATKESMVPLVKQFMSMGVTSQDAIEKMTTAAMSAKALTGGSQSAADAFTKLSKKIQVAAETGQSLKIPLKGLASLAEMGLTVDDVAQKMGISQEKLAKQLKAGSVDAKKFGSALQDALIAKGAGPLETMNMSLSNLGGLLKEYVGDLFEDMSADIKPFLAAVKDLFGIIDSKANPSGKALKAGIEGFFKNVFAVATKVVPMIKHFLLDIIIFGLKAYLSLKPIVKTLQEMFAKAGGMETLTKIFNAMKPVLIIVAVAIGVVLVVLGLLWAMMVGIGVVIVSLVGIIIDFVAKAAMALGAWAISATQAAGDFISGLVNGISSGVGAVVDAVTGLAGKAKGAFKAALGIHSPSKVMMQMGSFAGQGVAEGMNAAAPDVHAASKDLASAASGGMQATPASSAPSSGGGGGSGVTVNVEPGAIVIQGAGKGADELTETAVAMLFERVALAQGL